MTRVGDWYSAPCSGTGITAVGSFMGLTGCDPGAVIDAGLAADAEDGTGMELSRRDFGGLAVAAGVAAVMQPVSVPRGVTSSHVPYWQACTDVRHAPDRAIGGTVLRLPTLQAHHAAFDWQGIAAYLEASGQRTRDLYLRHGYTDHGEPIELPDGPSMYPMVGIPGLRPHRGPAAS